MLSRSTPGSEAAFTEAEDTLDDPANRCLAELISRERVELEAELTVEGRGLCLQADVGTESTDSHSRTLPERVPAEVTRVCPALAAGSGCAAAAAGRGGLQLAARGGCSDTLYVPSTPWLVLRGSTCLECSSISSALTSLPDGAASPASSWKRTWPLLRLWPARWALCVNRKLRRLRQSRWLDGRLEPSAVSAAEFFLKEKSGGRRPDWDPPPTEGSWGVDGGWEEAGSSSTLRRGL